MCLCKVCLCMPVFMTMCVLVFMSVDVYMIGSEKTETDAKRAEHLLLVTEPGTTSQIVEHTVD